MLASYMRVDSRLSKASNTGIVDALMKKGADVDLQDKVREFVIACGGD